MDIPTAPQCGEMYTSSAKSETVTRTHPAQIERNHRMRARIAPSRDQETLDVDVAGSARRARNADLAQLCHPEKVYGIWAQSVPLTWTRPTLVFGDCSMGFAQLRQAVGRLGEFCRSQDC
eukprot:8855590-Lingulodinium_polyedra.AAC.1